MEAARRQIAAFVTAEGDVSDPVSVLQQVRNNLYGFDLNPFACHLAEVNLLIQALDLVS